MGCSSYGACDVVKLIIMKNECGLFEGIIPSTEMLQ